MKIIIDSAIPFLNGIFEPYAEVCYTPGGEFTPSLVHDADVLIIRTRTKCNAALLDGSSVKLIASATIGYDHIDLEYCHQHNIKVTSAAGCNARGVLQWVGAALVRLSKTEGWHPTERRLGVVGVGNVGSLVAQYGKLWGFEVLCCDPPRAKCEEGFIELEELLRKVDIVTFHTPLNDETFHLLNSRNIKLLKPDAAIINTARGEVVSSSAIRANVSHPLLFDVWEGEPNIDREILERAEVSTPHIAGYSRQGKANGSAMVVESVAKEFNLPLEGWYPDVEPNGGAPITWDELCQTINNEFNIESESATLKGGVESFEKLRNSYNYRNEYF